MDIEFHNYMTHLSALPAGVKLNNNFAIAYLIQNTDTNRTLETTSPILLSELKIRI